MTFDQTYDQLAEALDLEAAAERAKGRAIHALRFRGESWQDIADALGITRQGAHKSWGDVDERYRRGDFDD